MTETTQTERDATRHTAEVSEKQQVGMATTGEFMLRLLNDADILEWIEQRQPLAEGREHLTVFGMFQSDKYPTVPAGKVPLSVRDPIAQPLLWEYAQAHRAAGKHGDSEFPRDLEDALRNAGYVP